MSEEKKGNWKHLLTAQDLADMFGISKSTLHRMLKVGPAQGHNRKSSVDFRMLPDLVVGGKRYWHRAPAEELFQETLNG